MLVAVGNPHVQLANEPLQVLPPSSQGRLPCHIFANDICKDPNAKQAFILRLWVNIHFGGT